MASGKITAGLKILVVLVWAGLFLVLLRRDYFVEKLEFHEQELLAKAQEESFAGVFFKGERIGFVENKLKKNDDGSLFLSQSAELNLNIVKQNYPVKMNLQANLTGDFLLTDFEFSISSPLYTMDAEGRVAGKVVDFTIMTGKEEIRDSLTLSSPPLLSVHQRAYLLQQNLEPGDKRKIAYFDPLSLSGKDTIVEYKGVEKILIRGRISLLHHFVESFSGMRISSWLDDTGKVIKEESPAGFVFISEPEYKARNVTRKGQDILQSVAVPFKGNFDELQGKTSFTYRLVLPEGGEFDLDGGRQQFAGDLLTIRQESIPGQHAEICADETEALQPSVYVQSDHNKIVSLARDLTEDAQSAIGKVRVLSDWLYTHLEKRPVLGIPDAVTTLQSMKGDCNEHAALFAALARSSGIPARIASGVTFHEGAFYYHAWNEVCIDNRWISLDTTKNQFPADLSHIRFVIGETKEQIRIGALLGKLQIFSAQ